MKQMKKYRFLPKAQISSVIRPIVHLSLDESKVLFPKYSVDCLSFQLLNSYIQMLYAADHSSCPAGRFQEEIKIQGRSHFRNKKLLF